ncbi:MAG: hypothetical protein H6753_01465 [Candidatus Omnitrophica bacterium]|nr:hypothetical protein [Candidatus Omnitrophota bacterium]
MRRTARLLMWLAIGAMSITGLIHGIEAPDGFTEAAYKGWLFYANALGSLLAAWGILQQKDWGWNLGMVIAVGSLAAYAASRTIGLPLIAPEPDAWLEPLGVGAFAAEALFVIIYFLHKKRMS